MESATYFKGLRVIVTGASGLIGSYCVKLLHEAGAIVHPVIGTRRMPNAFTRLPGRMEVANFMRPDDAKLILQRCAECVFHCAGITGGVGIVKKDPTGYVGQATVMALNMIDACALAGVPMGFLSSTTVYAPTDEPVREGVGEVLEDPYPLYRGISKSKRFLEEMCHYYHETRGARFAIIRPSGAYGRYDNFDEETSHVVPGLINRALALKSGEPFEVWGDGKDERDIVHAEDVARGFIDAMKAMLRAEPMKPRPYNIASGEPISTGALAELVLDAVGSEARIVYNLDKPTALRKRYVSIDDAKTELEYEPRIPLRHGLMDTVSWLRSASRSQEK